MKRTKATSLSPPKDDKPPEPLKWIFSRIIPKSHPVSKPEVDPNQIEMDNIA